MPACLSPIYNHNHKKYKLTFLLVLFPLFFFGQSLTGLWTGALSNDSTTVRKDQLFEIALTEYRGKVYGYSRSEFIVDDTLYYIVKRVKGTINGDICEVIDDEIISFNFKGKLDKGVKVTSTFKRNKTDSSWYLAGTWKTNATKKYFSVTGKVDLSEEKDLHVSKIFPHLEELNLAKEVVFYKERIEGAPIVKIAKPEKIKTEYSSRPDKLNPGDGLALAKQPDLQNPDIKAGPAIVPAANAEATTELVKEEPLPVITKPGDDLPKTDIKTIEKTTVSVKPTVTTKTIAKNTPPVVQPTAIETKKEEKKPEPVIVKTTPPVVEKKEVVSALIVKNVPKPEQPEKKKAVVDNPVVKTAATDIKKPEPVTVSTNKVDIATVKPITPEITRKTADTTQKTTSIAGRKSEFSQVVNFKSDSLELSLYDNGEIDGDTVSVFMNGEVIMAKQGLKASAIKKTIFIKKGEQEEFTLVLFADNLGKYPPNTGLLVVHDGEDIYHLRFSSDFQKSSGIVFRRQK